ncbi:MAG: magnetosome biogenesis CDF transporter MamM [Magnetococcales bacterium]|nr:magnetosome biogenesis CDF transporter MamM [Magnetococcales bacterium]
MRYAKCVVCNDIVGWVGLSTNLILATLKLMVGIISGSHALVVDSIYSAKDVVTSILIVIGLKVSSRPIDRDHPFGHGKVEFLLALVISLMLITVTGWLFYNAAEVLIEGEHAAPHLIALWTAIFSMLASFFLHFYTRCVSVEINSPMVMTLSRHHKGDGLSSLAVALAIIGSHYLDMPWLDIAVALGEGLHLIYLGGEVAWDAINGLLDSSAPRDVVQRIRRTAADVYGVEKIEELRTRNVGQELWITMVIGVDPDLSVRQAKSISNRVEEELATHIDHVGDVCVHFRSREGSVPELNVIKQEMERLHGDSDDDDHDHDDHGEGEKKHPPLLPQS